MDLQYYVSSKSQEMTMSMISSEGAFRVATNFNIFNLVLSYTALRVVVDHLYILYLIIIHTAIGKSDSIF